MQQDFLHSQSKLLFVLHFAFRDHGIDKYIFDNVHKDCVYMYFCLNYFGRTT